MTNKEEVTVLVFPGERTIWPLGVVDREFTPVGRERWVGKRCGFVLEPFREVMCQQVCEGQFEVDAFDAVLTDPDLLEEDLVVGAAYLIGGTGIRLETVCGEIECLVEVSLDLLEAQRA